DGRGGFSTLTSFSLASSPLSVATGDVNGDGLPDLVTANGNDDTVSILLNTGSGRFGPATNFGAKGSPFSLAVVDFNGDGHLDLAVAGINFSLVSLLLGDGTGRFVGGASRYVDAYPLSIVTGDINGDGKPDLATVSVYFSNDGLVSVLLNDGNGGFGKTAGFRVGTTPQSLVVLDVNGDGKPDLATVNYLSGDISVMLGDGQGGFSKAAVVNVGGNPQAIAVGDFNGDGRPDLATANKDLATVNNTNGTVSVLLNCTAQEADALTIAPNPTTDVVQVSLTDAYRGVAVITLVNAAGKVLQTYSFPGTGITRQHTVSTRGLPPGVYYLTVQQGQQRMTEKVLKY
ncbi:MAG: T9SS type A sorting domain-containing protein, partial [Bacteroidetes bacterium]|nr:T9SS type A sorting domain-containing protein [Fibrella sp.]